MDCLIFYGIESSPEIVMVIKQEVKKRLSSEAAAAANRSGQWKNQMRRVAHNGCCRRVAQTRALCSVLWKLIISEELMAALNSVEIPLVNFVLPVHFAEGKIDTKSWLF